MDQPKMEILAPAGDEEMLRAAVFSGADCVYLGFDGFNARRGAGNFTAETLTKAISFCHARNCRVYVALNTLVYPEQLPQMQDVLHTVATAGADSIIVQDLAMARLVHTYAPGVALHASTQMSVHSLAGVQQLAKMGFNRAILARELSEKEIAHIAAHSPIELEVFVHGALCVSVSGQCYMSAFLGGRSANRGACAGTCRLPFSTENAQGEQHRLSLKDLSILDALPRLAKIGVVSAKIEGRLRGPEYCAAVVDAAKKSLQGEPYDAAFVQDVFSRRGFSSAWFDGHLGEEMLGTRTAEDTAASKSAQPRARELYRREKPRVPIQFTLSLSQEGGHISLTDSTHTITKSISGPLQLAQKDASPTIQSSLEKTGGTPFYVTACDIESNGFFLPGSTAGALRRDMLDELLTLRSLPPTAAQATEMPAVILPASTFAGEMQKKRKAAGRPLLRGRFEHASQMPANAENICEQLIFPLFEAEKVPAHLRAKSYLWLPRVLFGKDEERAMRQIEATRDMGFLGYEAENLAHIHILKGSRITGGFGLNIANPLAAEAAAEIGCSPITLSVELTLRQMQQITSTPSLQAATCFDMLCYGHMPVMLTRACPLPHAGSCGGCTAHGSLQDRKGTAFSVSCRDGARTIYNPVPLWMGDRLSHLPTTFGTLYFTGETKEEAEDVMLAFAQGAPAPGNFTRGLYDKGTAG